MKKITFAVLAIVPALSMADGQQAQQPDVKDPFHFCYFDGKAYSKGARIVDQTKLVQECKDANPMVKSYDKPLPLEWSVDTPAKRM